MVHLNRLEELQKACRLISPHVDRTIIVDGDSRDGSIEWLNSSEAKKLKIDVFVHPWTDDPPGQRNKYLQYAGNDTWVLVTDCDEFLEEPCAWTLKDQVADAEKKGIGLIRYNAHDIQWNPGSPVWHQKSNYWNPMLFKMTPQTRYVGHTHVGLNGLVGQVYDSPFRYFHIKSVPDQWFRGARNYWTTARPAANVHDSKWINFRAKCSAHGIKYFYEIAKLMEEGKVPEDIKQWMIDNRDDENSEIKSYFITYLVFMHPELNPGLSNSNYQYIPNREPVRGMKF